MPAYPSSRSSESANSARIAISVRIRCLLCSRKMLASATSQNAISSTLQRAREASRPWASATSCGLRARSFMSLGDRAREQALRPPDQDDDYDDVDVEGAELRRVVFAGDIAEAEEQRRDERSGDARRAADGHHNQEEDHELEGEVRIEPEDSRAERAAEARKPRADRERDGEYGVDVDAKPARDARIIDGAGQARAEAGSHQRELQRDGEQAADQDDEQAIAADADAEEVDLALQVGGDRGDLLLRAHHEVDACDRHEHEADREQHLFEMRLGVDVNVERALEHQADHRGQHEGDRQGGEAGHAVPVDEHDRDVAARHGKGAMREVDEVHQPERDGSPAWQYKQQHAVGHTVEQDGQNERWPLARSV